MVEDLVKRLALKPGMSVLVINAPAGYVEQLRAAFPEGEVHALEERPGGKGHFDMVHLFALNRGELESFYNTAHAAMRPDSNLWISYPKQSSGIKSDLNRDSLFRNLTSDGWQAMGQTSLGDVWSAMRYKLREVDTPVDVVQAQYSGSKAELRPIYNYILEIVMKLGDDVRVAPRSKYVAFSRKYHFAAVAATQGQVDLALKLKGRPFDDFLQQNTGIGGESLTHKVTLHSTADVDDVVIALLHAAYEGTK